MSRRLIWIYLAAFLWGAAESSFFFIIPDVFITAVALKSCKHALGACVFSVLGAMLGGGILFLLSESYPLQVSNFLVHIPAIDNQTLADAQSLFDAFGGFALFNGAFGGIPYKVLVEQAALSGMSLTTLLLLTIPARLLRFITVALIANATAEWLNRRKSYYSVAMWGLCWVVVYGVYWM